MPVSAFLQVRDLLRLRREGECATKEQDAWDLGLALGAVLAQRALLDQLNFLYPGSAFAENWIGGRDETIAAATAQRLRDFYQRWYRPDNAAIMLIGDFDAEAAEAAIAQHFASWQAAPVEMPASAGPIASPAASYMKAEA